MPLGLKVGLLVILVGITIPLFIHLAVEQWKAHKGEHKATFEHERLQASHKGWQTTKKMFVLAAALLFFIFIIGKWPVS
jgi:hypothetical protein